MPTLPSLSPPLPRATSDGGVLSISLLTERSGGWSKSLHSFDRLGSAVCGLGDLNNDGSPDLAAAAPDYNISRGVVYVAFLNASGYAHNVVELGDGFALDMYDFFGSGVADLGDLDGDGITDIAVGALGDDGSAGPDTGAVYFIFLLENGTAKPGYFKLSNETTTIGGGVPLDACSEFGHSVAFLGHVDGDSNISVAVGAPGANAVYVLSLVVETVKASTSRRSLGSAGHENRVLEGAEVLDGSAVHVPSLALVRMRKIVLPEQEQQHGALFGTAVSLILGNDGSPALAVGAPGVNASSTTGGVYIFSLTEELSLIETISAPVPVTNGLFGQSLALGADWDGNGIRDLVVGSPGVQGGALYILFRGTNNYKMIFASNVGDLASVGFGQSVALVGLVNDDLVPDIAAGVPSLTVGNLTNAGGVIIAQLTPFQYPYMPPQLPSLREPKHPPTLPPPSALPLPGVPIPPLPPVPPTPPNPPLAVAVAAVRTPFEASLSISGLALALIIISSLLCLAAMYYACLLRRRPSRVCANFANEVVFITCMPFEFWKWLHSPIMRMQLGLTKIEFYKPSAVEAAIAGRDIRKVPPQGVTSNGLIPMPELPARSNDGIFASILDSDDSLRV